MIRKSDDHEILNKYRILYKESKFEDICTIFCKKLTEETTRDGRFVLGACGDKFIAKDRMEAFEKMAHHCLMASEKCHHTCCNNDIS